MKYAIFTMNFVYKKIILNNVFFFQKNIIFAVA